MKLNTYKNYRICPECKLEFPLTREFFRRNVLANGKEAFHHICRSCEIKIKMEYEWKDGKLLCHGCGEYKDISNFSKSPKIPARNNHNTFCNACRTKRTKENEHKKSNKTRLKLIFIQRYHGAKDRSAKLGIEFNITLEDIQALWDKQKGICAISGIPMTYERYNGRIPTNVSIDRIDGSKGYVLDNILLVCMACNQIKSDWSEEVMYNICKKIVEQYESKNNKSSKTA